MVEELKRVFRGGQDPRDKEAAGERARRTRHQAMQGADITNSFSSPDENGGNKG